MLFCHRVDHFSSFLKGIGLYAQEARVTVHDREAPLDRGAMAIQLRAICMMPESSRSSPPPPEVPAIAVGSTGHWGQAMMPVLYHRDLATDIPPQRELRDAFPNTFSSGKLHAEPKLPTRFPRGGSFAGRPAFFPSGNRFL